jgi:hypothetical protein
MPTRTARQALLVLLRRREALGAEEEGAEFRDGQDVRDAVARHVRDGELYAHARCAVDLIGDEFHLRLADQRGAAAAGVSRPAPRRETSRVS